MEGRWVWERVAGGWDSTEWGRWSERIERVAVRLAFWLSWVLWGRKEAGMEAVRDEKVMRRVNLMLGQYQECWLKVGIENRNRKRKRRRISK